MAREFHLNKIQKFFFRMKALFRHQIPPVVEFQSTKHGELWEGISSLQNRGPWKSEHLSEQEWGVG